MRPRAFVIMPFGRKKPLGFDSRAEAAKSIDAIDFDGIYKYLFEPALYRAGYEVARADSEVAAGDIRTDMFFELVTADLVVADISILNANVYYELGVRHGVCPRGVFVVNASSAPAPFDVAPDRSFTYDATLFTELDGSEDAGGAAIDKAHLLRTQVDHLAKRFSDASTLDGATTGSPVYSHLPGLQPVNWNNIEISKAKYFSALQTDWLDCVREAQANGHPGDILTLAMNAPTRLHEARILYEAAKGLINLCRYGAAKNVLCDVIRLQPEHADARINLALVLSHLSETTAAEQELRRILTLQKGEPKAADLLGQVFRYLWHLSWQDADTVGSRRGKAKDACQLAISAIHSFSRAHRVDPGAYFAGFNALMLAHVLCQIGVPRDEICAAQVRDSASIDLDAVKALVRYAALNEQRKAIENGDYVEQFWCTTTLAGLLLIENEGAAAKSRVREACAIPAATSFQLQTFRDRLQLLAELEVQNDFVVEALDIVDQALQHKNSQCDCDRVFLWHGYGLDNANRESSRFAPHQAKELADRVEQAMKDWNLGPADLGLCGGMTESDIVFAETCLKFGSRLRIMLREPVGDELKRPLWPVLASPEWYDRFHELVVPGDNREVWLDTRHLGSPPSGSSKKDQHSLAITRHKQWLLNTAKMEASPILKPGRRVPQKARLYGLFLWQESDVHDDADDSSYFVREVNAFEGYQGIVKILSLEADKSAAQPDARGKPADGVPSNTLAQGASVQHVHVQPLGRIPMTETRPTGVKP